MPSTEGSKEEHKFSEARQGRLRQYLRYNPQHFVGMPVWRRLRDANDEHAVYRGVIRAYDDESGKPGCYVWQVYYESDGKEEWIDEDELRSAGIEHEYGTTETGVSDVKTKEPGDAVETEVATDARQAGDVPAAEADAPVADQPGDVGEVAEQQQAKFSGTEKGPKPGEYGAGVNFRPLQHLPLL